MPKRPLEVGDQEGEGQRGGHGHGRVGGQDEEPPGAARRVERHQAAPELEKHLPTKRAGGQGKRLFGYL